jgi:hypothetical protein
MSLYVLSGFVAVTYVSRHVFAGLTLGDPGDSRITMTILEHWRTVILGHAADWRSPIFFFPKAGVLGNTDAYVLFALPYTLARMIFDEFLSYDLSMAALFIVGFASMALLLRSGLRLSHPVSVLGAILFTVFSSIYQRTIHAQLIAVETIPLLIWLAIAFARSTSRRDGSVIGVSGAMVFAATCMTGFYIAWFFGLLIAWAAIVAICMFGAPAAFRSVLGFAKAKHAELAVFGLSLLIGLYPFASLYVPRLIENGPQPLSEAFGPGRSQHAWDLIAVGNNYFWGDLLGTGGLGGRIFWNPSITPLFGLAMLCSVVGAFVCFRLDDLTSDERTRVLFVRVFGIAVLLLWMSFVDWGVIQPYVFYYRFVPGGSAMRVPARLVLLFPAVWVPIVAIGAYWILKRISRFRWTVFAGLAILIVEQHSPCPQLSTNLELARERLAKFVPAPARYCASFYVVGFVPRSETSSLVEFFYGPQVDAMTLAYRFRIPTLNGNSTVYPPGWNIGSPIDPKYMNAVNDWISRNGLSKVCRLDLFTGEWRQH